MDKVQCIENFRFYLDHHPALVFRSGKIVFAHDESHRALVENVVAQLKEGWPGTLEIQVHRLETTPTETLIQDLEQSTLSVLFHRFYTLQPMTPEGPEFLRPLRLGLKYQWRKTVRYMDAGDHFYEIYSTPPEVIARLQREIVQLANRSKWMHITDRFGTDLKVDLTTVKPWTFSSGIGTPDILPAEISTCTENISGKAFFVGTFLSFTPFARKYGLLKEPLEITFEKGKVIDLSGTNKPLVKDLESHFARSEGNRFVDEIAIGTNPGVKNLYALNAEFEERHAGLHIGLGGARKGSHHLDLLFNEARIHFDKQAVFDQTFDESYFVSSL